MAKNKCVKSVEKKTLTKADKKHRHHASKALKVLFRPPSNLSTVEMLRTGAARLPTRSIPVRMAPSR